MPIKPVARVMIMALIIIGEYSPILFKYCKTLSPVGSKIINFATYPRA